MYANHVSHWVGYILERKKIQSCLELLHWLSMASGLFSCGHMWCLQQVLGPQWQKAGPVTALLIFSYLALMSPRFLRTYRLPPCDLQQRPKPNAQVVISRWCFTEAPCFYASCFQVKSCRLEWGFHLDSNSLERIRQDSSTTRALFPSVVVTRNVCYLLFTDKTLLYQQNPYFIQGGWQISFPDSLAVRNEQVTQV